MRILGLGVVCVALAGGAARAQTQASVADNDKKISTVTNPDWLRKPTQAEAASFWPSEATKQGLSQGRAVVKCQVSVEGKLESCTALSESPAGAGFGGAAVAMTSVMLMKPKTVDGHAVGGAEVTIPINFIQAASAPNSGNVRFAQAPTFQEKLAVWPRDASRHFIFGTAKMDCHGEPDGSVDRCQVVEEYPKGQGIGEAALKLATRYRLTPGDNAKLANGILRAEVGLDWDVPPKLVKGVTPEQVQAAYPKEADGQDGSAQLACFTDVSGALKNCRVVSEIPVGGAFGKAALALAGAYVVTPASANGKVISTVYNLPFRFSTALVINPNWLRKPTLEELMAVYPRTAAEKGVSGKALIHCWVKVDGLLRTCTVINEDPPGLGFGTSALVLSPTFLMKPATKNGQPVEAEISIPIAFQSRGAVTGPNVEKTTIIGATAWAKTPTMAEILDAIDKKVGDKFAEGKVVFMCDVNKKTGRLSNCIVANSAPGMVQFTGVAKSLVSKFQVAPAILATIKDDSVRVNLAFSFPDMSSAAWGKRYLERPQWVRTINLDAHPAIFPDQAAKAGLKSGSSTVDCVIGPDGRLGQCTTLSESAPDLGFGDIAQKIAETFVANPWTDDGLPAEGAHVKLPIKMVEAEPEPTPPGAAPTPTTKPQASP